MLNTEIIIRRLAFIKYLYQIGVNQSKQVDSIAGFSLMSFHDSIEMFLLLVAEHNNEKSDNLSFMGFWDKFPALTLKESMRSVKDRRVNIKHKGLFPSKSDVEISRIGVTDFFNQNTKIQFGIEFEDISLLDLIDYDMVKLYLRKAQTALKDNDNINSLLNSAIAFRELIMQFENNKSHFYSGNQPFNFGNSSEKSYTALIGNDQKTSKWFEGVNNSIDKIQEALKLISIGIDFKRYSVFKILTPFILNKSRRDIEWRYYIDEYQSKKIKSTNENCQFCIDFVLDCALKSQEFDFDIKEYTNY